MLATPQARAVPDAELEAAWYRFACHLNPANPGCTTVGIAVKCAVDAAYPGCADDGDGDSCTDIAEVRTGFDPFNSADCMGGAGGEPAVNCLFLFGGLSCGGGRVPEGDGCERSPRDPGCDGFAPAAGG